LHGGSQQCFNVEQVEIPLMTCQQTSLASLSARQPVEYRIRAWLGPLAMLIVVIVTTAGMILTVGAGASGTPVVAIYPPTWDQARSVTATARAGGPIVGLSSFGWMVVTISNEETTLADLRREGAIFFLNAGAARLCGA
jgi:hypothetical protein